IRLARIGKKKKPYYRVVVIERTRARDGRVRDAVGTYDPLKKPAEIKLNSERIKYWLGVGAQPSDTVRSFIKQEKIAENFKFERQLPARTQPVPGTGSASRVRVPLRRRTRVAARDDRHAGGPV